MDDPSPAADPTLGRLQAARLGVDPVDAGHALARLENALFSRARKATIGRYTLLRRLGQGGAGIVWLAHDPRLDREVAIKLLRREVFAAEDRVDSERRLVREARALAHLSHPNVLEIYGIEHVDAGGLALDDLDGGADPIDLVLVMEYVDGATLARWLELEPRSVGEILAAFLAAGQGLAAVHELGLVHRDFKPANVMVGKDSHGAARIKVLDFGLAGLASRSESAVFDVRRIGRHEHGITDSSSLGTSTVIGGTPLYMAPEQHAGADVDARTDQFAFCVSLWIALFGAPPFVGGSADTLAEAKRSNTLQPPRRRGVSRALGRALVRGLASDPADRWPSMRALLAALAGPRPPARRHAPRALAALVPVLAVGWLARPHVPDVCADTDARLAGVWDPASREAFGEHLRSRAADGSELPEILEERLAGYASSWSSAWRESCVAADGPAHDARVACLEHARDELAGFVEAQRRIDSRGLSRALEGVLGLPPIEHCMGLAGAIQGPPTIDDSALAPAVAQARSLLALAKALGEAGDHAEGLATARDALERARTLGWGPLRADALIAVGDIETMQGEYLAAEADLREAYFEAVESGHDAAVVRSASALVYVVGYKLARHSEGLEWARHAEARLGSPLVDPLDGAALRNSMGAMFDDAGELDEAARQYELALALFAAEGQVDDLRVATLHNNLANLAERRKEFAKAEAEHRIALAVHERVLGEDHELTAMSWNNLAIALHRQDRAGEAEPYLRRALAVRERVLGGDHPLVGRTHMNLGVTLRALDRLVEGEAHLRRALTAFERSLGPTHPDFAHAWLNLANLQQQDHRLEDALASVERGRAILESTLPSEHPYVRHAVDMDERIRGRVAALRDPGAAGPSSVAD